MGIYDRDYYRAGRGSSFGSFQIYSITVWLILINVAVFVIDSLLQRVDPQLTDDDVYQYVRHRAYAAAYSSSWLQEWGHFSVDKAIYHLQLWRLITFQFLHASLGHLFGNMLGLYFFGPIVESYLNRQRFLLFYLLCGVAGALSYIVLWAMHLLIADAATPMVGASAGVFGVLLAAGVVAPGMTITLWFPPVTLEVRILAWIMVAIAAFTVFNYGRNAGGEAAHLGGALVGYAMITHPHVLNWIMPPKKGAKRLRRIQKDWSKDLNR